MANIGDFEGMLIFGSERHPPQTGWTPFVEICLRYGRQSEANQFIKWIKVTMHNTEQLLLCILHRILRNVLLPWRKRDMERKLRNWQ